MERWMCEGPGCERDATAVWNCELGNAYLCKEHMEELAAAPAWPSWLRELFAPREPRPRPLTALSCDGFGVIVHGSVRSVELTIKDAIRLGQPRVALMTDAGLFELETAIEWDFKEMRRAER